MSVWTRGPIDVTLTVTDATGATARATTTVMFAQGSTAASATGCPRQSSPQAAPSVAAITHAAIGGTRITIGIPCPAGSIRSCTGDAIISSPSIVDETRREQFRAKFRKLTQLIDKRNASIATDTKAIKALQTLNGPEVPRTLAAVLGAAGTPEALAASRAVSVQQAAAILGRAVAAHRTDLSRLRRQQRAGASAIRKLEAALLARRRRATFATAHRVAPDVLGVAPYSVPPGKTASVRPTLSRVALRVLRRYRRLQVNIGLHGLTADGKRTVRSRTVTLTADTVRHPGL